VRITYGVTGVLLLSFAGACATAGEPTGSAVRMHKGRPMVFVNDRPTPLPGYSPFGWVPWRFQKTMPRFYPHKMGVYFLSLPRLKGDLHSNPFWVGDRVDSRPVVADSELAKNSFKSIDESARLAMAGDPGAGFIIRFGLHEPKSWRELHPQDYFLTDEGTVGPAPSLASEAYWDTTVRFSAAVVRYCEGRPWAHRIIGYANFHRTEGGHAPVIHRWLFDHNPLMVARYRQFLKDKYKTVDKLQEAHNDPAVTFNSVDVPRDPLRGPVPEVAKRMYWQPAKGNQALRDYLRLQSDLFNGHFKKMARAMRAAAPKGRIILIDALKQTMQGFNNTEFFAPGVSGQFSYPELRAGSGNMNGYDLFDTADFDGLITPHVYHVRAVGGVCEPEGSVDSTVLRGKVFFCELDTRSWVNERPKRRRLPPRYGTALNAREFEAITWRNVASALSRGYEVYWMDQVNDWFGDPAIQKVIGRTVEVIKQSADWEHEALPGIAMIIDDTATLETNGSGRYPNQAIIREFLQGMARCGVPYRIYILEDLALANFPEHRVFYFPNLFRVDDARLKLLKEKVFRNGHVVLWGPGSGISDGKTIDAAHAQRLTGFAFNTIKLNFARRTLVSDFTHPITRDLKADVVIGGALPYGPAIYPKDGTPLGLAWTKYGQSEVGLAVKEFGNGVKGRGPGDYAAVFTTGVPIPADLWRGLARFAGAHVYNEENDVLMAGGRIVAVHSLKTGPRHIRLPQRCDVVDLVTGKPVAERTTEIRFELEGPETRVFLLTPVEQ